MLRLRIDEQRRDGLPNLIGVTETPALAMHPGLVIQLNGFAVSRCSRADRQYGWVDRFDDDGVTRRSYGPVTFSLRTEQPSVQEESPGDGRTTKQCGRRGRGIEFPDARYYARDGMQ
jgi:hypothetical protein